MIRVFSFLQRHPQSGILYFRRAIPERHRSAFGGRREIKCSLRTYDKGIAVERAMGLYARLESRLNELDGVPTMSDDNFFSKITLKDLDVLSGKVGKVEIDYDGDDVKEAAALAKVRAMLAQPVPEFNPGVSVRPVAVESEKLSVVCRKYREEKMKEGSWTSKTDSEHETTFAVMLQFFRDVQMATVTTTDARLFKDALFQLPPNMNKGKFAGKTIKQILAMKPEKTMAPQTVNGNYIQRYSSLFAWAVRQGYCAINPFEGLKLKRNRNAIEERHPFNAEELRMVFAPATFNLGKLKPWQYWVPLIALYSGARQQEIAQLRIADIVQSEDVWGFRIEGYEDEHEANGRLKNAASARTIPIHPVLIEKGLLDYVDSMRSLEADKLFPELFETRRIKAGDVVSRWFNRTYFKACGLSESDRKINFHSFRHNFTDCLKKAHVPEALAAQIGGRKHQSITYGTYGSAFSLKEMYDVMAEVVKFEIDLETS